ncbi:MAG: efflux RND transporter periplasmic adaptor subunit [Spongiibacteraceae bacterium]|nr:efflux RND transporter periplasmic adaptor subunit [Spongiibacteraceae bacterium]
MPAGQHKPPLQSRFNVQTPHRRRVLFGIVIVVIASGIYALTHTETAEDIKPLISTLSIGHIENKVTAAGSLQPSKYVDVGAQVSGQLEKLYVDIGEQVEQGQLLAQIDASIQAQQVAASKASLSALQVQLASRKAALALAQSNTERQERLIKEDATSQLEFDTAFNNLVAAQSSLAQLSAQIQQSQASLARDQAQLGYSKIYAPIAGTVVSIDLKEGQTLNATQQAPTIMRIADLSVMTVETQVSEADVGKLKKGIEVYFTTLGAGKRRWYGKLRQILPTPENVNNVILYTALFNVDNHDATLLSEMTAQVFFITASARNVVTVPVGALTYLPPPSPHKPPFNGVPPSGMPPTSAPDRHTPPKRIATVKVVNEKGGFDIREVHIGLSSRVLAEVISGLKAGDQVVAGIQQTSENGPSANKGGKFKPRMGGFR